VATKTTRATMAMARAVMKTTMRSFNRARTGSTTRAPNTMMTMRCMMMATRATRAARATRATRACHRPWYWRETYPS